MRPANFKQANKELLKPNNMTDEECGSLSVYTDGTVCISLWEMTLKERVMALLFGKIWLFVHSGYTQPPVAMMTDKTVFGETIEHHA